MNEDVQPNERRTNRKGASIPVIRSTPAIDRGRGSFRRGDFGTRYQQKPMNRPNKHYSFASQHNHQQHSYLGQNTLYNPHNAKRRRIDYDRSTEPHSQPEQPDPLLLSASRLHAKPRKRKAQHEPLELLIDLPPHCRKGAPDSNSLRKSWQTQQIVDLSAQTGVPVRCAGYTKDCARFVIDETPGRPRGGSHEKAQSSGSHLSAEILSVSSPEPTSLTSDVLPSTIDDEIIIVRDVNTLNMPNEWLLPCSPVQSSTQFLRQPSPLRCTERGCPETPEPLKFPRAFRSGAFTVSLRQNDLQSLPSSPMQRSFSPTPSNCLSPLHFRAEGGIDEIAPGQGEQTVPSVSSASETPDSPPDFSTTTNPSLLPFNNDTRVKNASNIFSHRCAIGSEAETIQLPLSQSDKVRRLVRLDTGSGPITSVSMRGSVELFDFKPLRHRRTVKSQRAAELIDDACIVHAGSDYLMVFGHARDQEQLSWCRFRSGATQNECFPLSRPWNSAKKGGVSAVASMIQPMQFATGGYDHVVHLWDVKSDLSAASPQALAIKHTSQVQSLLAIRDTSHKLVSAGADCNVHVWDLSSERVVNTLRPSNAIYHLHAIAPPFCTLLEVAHRELQFEVRDHRLVPECPVIRFGYGTDKVHGRFIKGASSSNMFACGSRDGFLRLWDLRNVKSSATKVSTHRGEKIVQVAFKKAELVVCTESGHTSVFPHGNESG